MPANGTSDMAAAEVKPTVKGLNRTEALASIMQDPVWDVVVVGGGATGAGVALDAASRGLKTLLLEAQDFSAGTSSRSTKLIHGGVRYLKNPRDWGLVHDALVERKRLIDNCPQLVHAEPFVLPCFKKWEREIYMAGLGFYGAMAGKDQIGRTRMLKPEEAEKVLPGAEKRWMRTADHTGTRFDARQHGSRNTKDVEQFVIPLTTAEVAQQRSGSIGRIGDVLRTAR